MPSTRTARPPLSHVRVFDTLVRRPRTGRDTRQPTRLDDEGREVAMHLVPPMDAEPPRGLRRRSWPAASTALQRRGRPAGRRRPARRRGLPGGAQPTWPATGAGCGWCAGCGSRRRDRRVPAAPPRGAGRSSGARTRSTRSTSAPGAHGPVDADRRSPAPDARPAGWHRASPPAVLPVRPAAAGRSAGRIAWVHAYRRHRGAASAGTVGGVVLVFGRPACRSIRTLPGLVTARRVTAPAARRVTGTGRAAANGQRRSARRCAAMTSSETSKLA